MLQEERSERSRTAILDAALDLFSHRGYGATSMRDIAGTAGVSTGSVYHHFKDKESIFQALLERFRAITQRPDFPINVALDDGAFLDDFTLLADAAREVLVKWRAHVALFYVDAVEFDGRHIQRFYGELAARFEQFVELNRERLRLDDAHARRRAARGGAARRGAGLHLLLLGGVHLRRRQPARTGDTGGDADHRRHPAARHAAAAARGRPLALPGRRQAEQPHLVLHQVPEALLQRPRREPELTPGLVAGPQIGGAGEHAERLG